MRGACQNNLRNVDVTLPHGEFIVVTGVSGSGKSSLVFDTLYAEGQRRYVETFSPYARQFLDRCDKPHVAAIEGVPPAIAIDQVNPVRTSRSTVGTMTELNDHLKLLFARAGTLCCRGCGKPVRRDTPSSIFADMQARAAAAGDPRLIVTFPVTVPKNFSEAEVKQLLEQQGYRVIPRGLDYTTSPSSRELLRSMLVRLGERAVEGDPSAASERTRSLVDLLVTIRARSRADGDYAGADAIRDVLASVGVELRDGPEGTIWEPREGA